MTFQPVKTQICHKCDILKKMSSLNSIQFHSSGCGLLPDWFSIDDSVTLSKHYKECVTPLSQCCSDFGRVYDGTLESHWPGAEELGEFLTSYWLTSRAFNNCCIGSHRQDMLFTYSAFVCFCVFSNLNIIEYQNWA